MTQSPNERPPKSEPAILVGSSSTHQGNNGLSSELSLVGSSSEIVLCEKADASTGNLLEAGRQMQETIGSLPKLKGQLRVLDIGMAPGWFTASVLERYPDARIDGITLSISQGGPRLPVDIIDWRNNANIRVFFHDITSYAFRKVGRRRPKQLRPKGGSSLEKYDLIVCDAQLPDCKLRRDPGQGASRLTTVQQTRLVTAQLILALQHINHRGTLYLCLKDITSRGFAHVAQIWYKISRFADAWFFRPDVRQGNGLVYLVATEVEPDHKAARWFFADLKKTWTTANKPARVTGGELTKNPAGEKQRLLRMMDPSNEAAVLTREEYRALKKALYVRQNSW